MNIKLLAALAITITMAAMVPAQAECYSSGIRTGVVQKFSQKGVMTKSWEGEMVQGGIRSKQQGTVTNIWKFSVTKPEAAKALEDAAFEGGEVAVKYCQSFINNPLVQDTPYEVVAVKAVK